MEMKMIGSKIAEARKKKNISQAELAGQLFISPQAVGKWERGESVPDIITINKLAKILDVSLTYFSEDFQSAGNKAAPEITNDHAEDTSLTAQMQVDSSRLPEQRDLTNFSGSNLPQSDFAGITAHKRKFNGSALRGSDFAGADLTGSKFTGSDVREANFDGTNLTDCSFSANDLTDSSFNKTILVRTEFSKSGPTGARFSNAKLIDAKLTKTDLRKTVFENCVFDGVDFKYSDLSGQCFDGQTFIGVKFHNTTMNNVTFNGATLKNVSFRAAYALTNKYYRAIQTIRFDGAMMDKLTYAALKGIGADLSGVTTI